MKKDDQRVAQQQRLDPNSIGILDTTGIIDRHINNCFFENDYSSISKSKSKVFAVHTKAILPDLFAKIQILLD